MIRSAVSVLVRMSVASRPGGGPGSAPSARRKMSFSVGRRSVTLIPCGKRRTTMPCCLEPRAEIVVARSQTKLPAAGGAS